MVEEKTHDPYELMSPEELKREAERLLSQFPKESIFEHHDGEVVFDMISRRHGSEYKDVLAQALRKLLQRAQITESYRQRLVEEFNGRYTTGGQGSFLEWEILGEEGTNGIFDPDFAKTTELRTLLAWKDLMMMMHGMNLEYQQAHPEVQSTANTQIITQMTTWREEFTAFHPE